MSTRASRTHISVTRPRGGGRAAVSFRVSSAADRPVLRPMLLASDLDGARVSLVPEGALLLAGDTVSIDIVVGAGARLELLEPAGTVAYPNGGQRASWNVTITLGPAAILSWAGEPFVVAEDAAVDRRTVITLGWGARLALLETLVLGRDGELPGHVHQELLAHGQNGVPVLAESLHVGPDSSPLLLGGSRVMGSVLTLGYRTPRESAGPGVTHLDLDGGGTVARALAGQVHQLPLDLAWAAARAGLVTQPRRSAPESRTPVRRLRPRTRLG